MRPKSLARDHWMADAPVLFLSGSPEDLWMNGSSDATHVLAICTRNRPQDLESCFNALGECLDIPPLILVIDSSDDEKTEVLCGAVGDSWGDRTQLVHVRADPGLTHQRNVALELAPNSCEVIFFIDDDAMPVPGYFDAVRKVFSQQSGCVGVGASVVPVDESGEPLVPVTRHGARVAASHFIASISSLRPENGQLTPAAVTGENVNRGDDAMGVEWLSGCAMSFRLDAARRTRFNEEELSGYALGEDVEFCLRIRRYGTLMLAPGTAMRHVYSPTNRLDNRRMAQMSVVNRHSFVRSFPDKFNRLSYWRSVAGLMVMASGTRNWSAVAGAFDGVREVVAKGTGGKRGKP